MYFDERRRRGKETYGYTHKNCIGQKTDKTKIALHGQGQKTGRFQLANLKK